MYFNPLKRTL